MLGRQVSNSDAHSLGARFDCLWAKLVVELFYRHCNTQRAVVSEIGTRWYLRVKVD